MLCKHAMRQPVQVISESEDVETAARRMRDANVGFLPVCNGDGAIVGTLTARDIALRVVAARLPPTATVADVMCTDIPSCKPTDEFFVAQQLMRDRHVSRIVCVDEARRPVGVITLSDVARHEDGFRLAKTVRSALNRDSKTSSG